MVVVSPQSNALNKILLEKNKKWIFLCILITSLFFCRGLVYNVYTIVVSNLRNALKIYYLQSSLPDSSAFIVCFIMALPAGYIIRKYDSKMRFILGLLLFWRCAIHFVPHANSLLYSYFFGAMFIITCMLTFLATAIS
jgi:fucose permease